MAEVDGDKDLSEHMASLKHGANENSFRDFEFWARTVQSNVEASVESNLQNGQEICQKDLRNVSFVENCDGEQN